MEDIGRLVGSIAARVSALTGVDAAEIERELELDRPAGTAWEVRFKGASSIVHEAVQQAVREIDPSVAGGHPERL